MKLRHLYLLLCVLGLLLPMSQFIPWLLEHGVDPARFVSDLFANRVSAFFGLDVIVSAVTLIVFAMATGRRERVPHLWAPVVGTLAVGVSFGLPLFLYLREEIKGDRSIFRGGK
jgi:Terpene cyclase DEP1